MFFPVCLLWTVKMPTRPTLACGRLGAMGGAPLVVASYPRPVTAMEMWLEKVWEHSALDSHWWEGRGNSLVIPSH